MNFKYQLVTIAFLGLVVHVHPAKEAFARAPSQATEIVDTAIVPEGAADSGAQPATATVKPQPVRKVLPTKTANGNRLIVTFEPADPNLKNEDIDELELLVSGKSADAPRVNVSVARIGKDGNAIPLDLCKENCQSITLDGSIDTDEAYKSLATSQDFKNLINKAKEKADAQIVAEKEAADEIERKQNSCEEGNLAKQSSCLITKIKSAKGDDKSDLQEQLAQRINDALSEQGKEEAVFKVIKGNSAILKSLDSAQANAIVERVATLTAGKNSVRATAKLNESKRRHTEALGLQAQAITLGTQIRALQQTNPQRAQELIPRYNDLVNEAQDKALDAQDLASEANADLRDKFSGAFDREFSSIFRNSGLSTGMLNLAADKAWEKASNENLIASQLLSSSEVNATTLRQASIMTDMYDVSSSSRMTHLSQLELLNGSLGNNLLDSNSTASALASRQCANQRNVDGICYNLTQDGQRPTVGGSNVFDRVNTEMQRLMGNSGISTPSFFTNSATSQQNTNMPLLNSGGGRPTVGGRG